MSSPGISLLHQGRYAILRRKNGTVNNYFLLGAVMVVLAFCGTFLILHFLSPGFHGIASIMKTDFNSRQKPHSGRLESGQCPAVCYSNECLRTAASVLEMLDPTVDPCEDFSLYACGGYNKIPLEHRGNKHVHLWDTEDEAVRLFRDLIKQIPTSIPESTPGSSLSKIRKFYDSCMDTVTSEENAVPTALKYLEQFGINHWPELNTDFVFSDPDLDEVLVRLAFYMQNSFFKVQARLFLFTKNETGSAVVIGFNSDRELKIMMSGRYRPIFHQDGKLEEARKIVIDEVLERLVSNVTFRNEILANVLSFDLALDNVIRRSDERRRNCKSNSTDDCFYPFPYNCSQEGNENANRWCGIARKILDRSGFSKKNSRIPLLLGDVEYFRELRSLIDSTDQRVIAHTLALQFFVDNAVFMNSGLRRKATLQGEDAIYIAKKYVDEIPEIGRSQFCTALACYRLPVLAETAFYAGKYNNTELRQEAYEIFSNVKEASFSTVREMTWLDTEAKEAAEKVLSAMYFLPEKYFSHVSDLSKIDALHQEMQISQEIFLANELEARKLLTTFYLRNMDDFEEMSLYYKINVARREVASNMFLTEDSRKTKYSVEKDLFEERCEYPSPSDSPYEFDVFFEDSYPAIGMELGNLQFPQYSINRPRYTNLGLLGYVIGHEIGHAIEIEIYGRSYTNTSQTFENAIKENKECFANHYSEYDVYSTGKKVNGSKTFFENMADFFGIRTAFMSLKKYQKNYGTSQMLPGLHFTDEQMFFILNAQTWCSSHTPEAMKRYFFDSHSPPNVRILGMDKNFVAFSEAFNCTAGSPMNPIIKCQV